MMQDWIAQLGDKLLHERGHQLPLVASLLVGCVLLWSIAQPVWRMLQGTQGVEVVPQAVAQATEVLPEFELAQLRALALFPAQSRAALAQLDAPETKLALVLKGILTGDEWRPASAIISRGERSPDEVFLIGDEVSTGATLSQVFADRVLLQYNGRLETLRLEEAEALGLVVASSTDKATVKVRPSEAAPEVAAALQRSAALALDIAQAQDWRDDAQVRGAWQEYVSLLRNQPGAFAEIFRWRSRQDSQGRWQGVELHVGERFSEAALRDIKLRAGDRVVQVNNESLLYAGAERVLKQRLQQLSEVKLVVQRQDAYLALQYRTN